MKKIVLLLIVSITLFGCGQDAIDDEGFTSEEIEVIVAEAETIVEASLTDAIQGDGLVDPDDIAEEIELLEDVVSAEAYENTILLNLTDGTELYYFFVDNTDDRWFTTNDTKASKSEPLKSKSQTTTSDIIKPYGSGKALILAPFQFQHKKDIETISNTLEDAGYITDPYINEDADLDKFQGSFMSAYDIVIIFTHGGASSPKGVNTISIVTGEKVSDNKTNQLKKQGKKGWKKSTCSGVEGLYYGITPKWLFETTYSPAYFRNTWIFVNGCLTSFWDNSVEGSLSKAFFDLGAEAYNGYKQIMYGTDVKLISRSMVEYFCSGLSFKDASESTKENVIIDKQSLLYDKTITTHTFDALQKNAPTPFYIVPPDGYQVLPSVNLSSIDNVTGSTADCNCEVTYEGWRRVTASGVCWNTSQNPTVANSKTTDGADLGPYTSNITGLSPNTTYYVRAYATNSQGTAYGEQRTFRTLTASDIEYGSFTDSRDGNVYKTVTIGEQVWMAENLAYLPSVVGPATGSEDEGNETEAFYYVYGYDGTDVTEAKAYEHTPDEEGEYSPGSSPIKSYETYGVLYNWTAAMTACPEGWHLPSDAEWKQLEMYLGMSEAEANSENYRGTDEGGKLKSGTTHWYQINEEDTNESGFTALPGGCRYHCRYEGYPKNTFLLIGKHGYWWSSSSLGSFPYYRRLEYWTSQVINSYDFQYYGHSVRCLRD
jgi:uncharacterized protein (TIGR02145 family)